ncbi:MFS transporter [Fastidiosibacter lacustris]|uniref:MFS transporter n=1 Tax=Fastidiosibacter lacustris TaxID=2056695 RepID=UPI000E351D3B|nr:MFS transporter [Fastidiosibacter lacustris]
MRQVSANVSYRFFLQAYLLIFSTEFMFALINPSYVQLFFDAKSPFSSSFANQYNASIIYGIFLLGGQIAGLVANIVWGVISDHVGRKPIATISTVALIITAITAILAEHWQLITLFVAGAILGHALYGMFPVVIASVSSAAYQSQRKLIWIGLLQFFTGLAFVIGPTVGSLLMINYANYMAPYYVVVLLAIVMFFIVAIGYYPEHYYQQQRVTHQKNVLCDLLHLLKQKKVGVLVWLLLLDQLAWGMYFQFIQPLAKLSLGFSISDIGYLVSFIGLSLMVSALVLLPILQRFLNHNMLFIIAVIAMLIGSFGAMLITFYPQLSKFWIYAVSFMVAFGDMVVFSLLVVGFSNAVPSAYQGFISGVLYTLAKGFGWGVSGFLGGYFISLHMFWSMGFATIMLLILLISFCSFRNIRI